MDETADETAEEIADGTAKEPTEETAEETAKPTAEQLAGELLNGKRVSEKPPTVEPSKAELASEERTTREQFDEGTSSDVVEVQPGPRKSGQIRRPPDFFVPAAFTTVYDVDDDDLAYDDAEDDEAFSELDPDMPADPEHRWDISIMTFRIDDTVECEKARLVVKGFTQVYGADYDETYAPVNSYVTLRIFLSIVAILDLNLMQLDMKNAFLQSKLDRVLYMYQPDYFNDGTGRVCKLLKSLYGLKQSPLLWYTVLNDVLVGTGWKKSQVDEDLYFKAGDDKVTCWVLVYVDDLLTASSSTAMLKELKELL
ncbi:unnamed protein product [Closterium sp. NIES-65]|nr:unnamed protein product [Closterium sp. NIES-65]